MSNGEIGTWYNPKTGQGHSGPREPGDVPADPTTGQPEPVGKAKVVEDYSKSKGGKPKQTITISRPLPDPASETTLSQKVEKTGEGEYTYTETHSPRRLYPSTQQQVHISELEKSKTVGEQIQRAESIEPIHQTASEFDKPPGQIPKGVQLGISSVIYSMGETFVETPRRAMNISGELGDRPGKVGIMLGMAKEKTSRETLETVQFAKEEPVAFAVSTGVQLAFFELGLRTISPFVKPRTPPKISTTVKVGEGLTVPKTPRFKETGIIDMVTKIDEGEMISKGKMMRVAKETGIPHHRISSDIIKFEIRTDFGKTPEIIESKIDYGRVTKSKIDTMKGTTGIGKVKTVIKDEMKISSGKFMELGKPTQKTLKGTKLPGGEIIDTKLIGTKPVEFGIELDIIGTEKTISQPLRKQTTQVALKTEDLLRHESEAGIRQVKMFEGFETDIKPKKLPEPGQLKFVHPVDETLSKNIMETHALRTLERGHQDALKLTTASTKLKEPKTLVTEMPGVTQPTTMTPKTTPKKASFTSGQIRPGVSFAPLKREFEVQDEDLAIYHDIPDMSKGSLKSELKLNLEVKTRTLQINLVRQRLDTLQILGVRQDNILREDTSLKQAGLGEQIQAQITLQKQLSLQKQLTRMDISKPVAPSSPVKPTSIAGYPSEFIIKVPRMAMPVRWPSFSATKKRKASGETKFDFRRDFEYTESLTAFGLDMKGKGKKPKKGKLFTGFELRPVFRKGKK